MVEGGEGCQVSWASLPPKPAPLPCLSGGVADASPMPSWALGEEGTWLSSQNWYASDCPMPSGQAYVWRLLECAQILDEWVVGRPLEQARSRREKPGATGGSSFHAATCGWPQRGPQHHLQLPGTRSLQVSFWMWLNTVKFCAQLQ